MATIDGGTLSFTSELNNDQLKMAIDETIARVKGLSDASVRGGAEMANAYSQAAQEVRARIGDVGKACEQHEHDIAQLSARYEQLGQQAAEAFKAGRDAEVRAIQEEQRAIQGEIKVRESLLNEMRQQSDVLETEAQKLEANAAAAEENATSHQSMRQRIRELKEEMVEMEMAGERNTEAYRRVQQEVAQLTDAWSDASQQANYLANDEAGFQGIMSGLTGLTGGFQAVSSAVSLFAGENENLQAAMLKVQQLMSITQGLQAVSQALNKDSYFQLVTLSGVRQWWNNIVAAGTATQVADTNAKIVDTAATAANTAATASNATSKTADTAAETANTTATTANTTATAANTAAKTAQSTATKAATAANVAGAAALNTQKVAAATGAVANIGLAGAFRMVGAAIKSIPVFGWIAAGIGALVSAIAIFSDEAEDAQQSGEDFFNSLAENAYKPIGSIMDLSQRWAALGDDMVAKEQFIRQNADAFDELGVSILGVADAENLLANNKDAFIEAQIEKAKAAVLIEQNQEKVKELIEVEQELANTQQYVTKEVVVDWSQMITQQETIVNSAYTSLVEKANFLKEQITQGYNDAAAAETHGMQLLTNAGIHATKVYEDGTLGAIEQAIARKREALNNLTNNAEFALAMAEIEDLERRAATIKGVPYTPSFGGIGGGGSGGRSTFHYNRPKPIPTYRPTYRPTQRTSTRTGGTGVQKDPFVEKLNKKKDEYSRYNNWMSSGDPILVEQAKKQFATLLENGKTYLDYLKRQREQILAIGESNRSSTQKKNLTTLNNLIADETKSSVMDAFNDALDKQLAGANNLLEQLAIIEQKRKELKGDGTELDTEQAEALNDAQENVMEQIKQEQEQLFDNYAGYVAKKKKLETDFNNDIALMERARLSAQTDEERAAIDAAIENRRKQYAEDSAKSGDEEYDGMLDEYKNFEQRRAAISADYDKKIAVARLHGNEELVRQLQSAMAKEMLELSFDELKASPAYAEAFTDVENVSTETLRALVARFEEVKIAAGEALNPQDMQAFADQLNNIIDEINNRDPFTTMINGYRDLRNAQRELEAAEKALAEIRAQGIGGAEEEKAVKRVNAAKDKYIKKNNEVKKAQKVVTDSVKKLCTQLGELGNTIGGTAGQIISIISDIGQFTLAAMDGIQTASEQSSKAIKAVETASVILAIVSAAVQVAQKIMSLLESDGGAAEYERASAIYEKYVSVLDDVIAKHKELIATLSDKDARNSYEYALEMLAKEEEAARKLGKQYLNTGATWKSHSHGVEQRKGVTSEAWQQWTEFAQKYGIAIDAANGRMTGLFDMTAEELKKLREEAPLFFATLHDETQSYIETIIATTDSLKELDDTLRESLTGVDYSSFETDFIDMMSNMDASAKDFTEKFKEYMRQALILQVFKSQFKSQLEQYYKMWADALDPSGTGGSDVTAGEQAALDALQNALITGAQSAADKINEQFGAAENVDESLTGAVAGVSEETASLIAGQMNAIRINQLESAETMRQSLLQLNTIAINTEYCRQLGKIDRIITILEGGTDESLRANGIVS